MADQGARAGFQRSRLGRIGRAMATGGLSLIFDRKLETAALEARVQKLRTALFDVTWTVINETEGHAFGKPSYDMTLDHLHDVAVAARGVLYDD